MLIKRTADPSASPDFLLNLVALANFIRHSLLKGAHVALSYVAWRKSGFARDDKGDTSAFSQIGGC